MRIIAGVAKGRTLGTVAGATRPTSDRAREGLFSSLLSEFGDFIGLHVLDLFGGSGAIALEALSRGATLVHIVEKDPEAQKTIENNFELVNKNKPAGNFHLYSMSAQRFVSDAPKEKYHIVYIDPPFDFLDVEIQEILSKLHAGSFLKDDAVIAVERTAKRSNFLWPEGYSALRERNYGQATIFYGNYTPKNG
ncbi:MAG: 16S rRNA (guanine(966)-N(2))-methyltransferase RsmD [Actinobacteria bacterium]|nr:16S rRNA (guanine(966)-N(2))-methyltransferase RsmD [Actinomycetota bacterium]NCW42862.1 16S rRNA (guanine(966)-N(2))-methyltransferase RsmD [Actinomycetota bacterium]NCW92290.1 16S rRNA (guanine(966)-N(2))-methyltransferase RsmD [Actinomycetota bacterium]NCX38034.1 16S rRNA (guanine(966)-N(2))-methyltransferase RsmD [Actinomycetota bacterium]NCX38734.1 16S rRNA (guanine(966)-N(2))-methyltransferase RsmD [Actinomycetota bacterium]